MSIAVSAVVKPSRLLRFAVLGFAAANIGVALVLLSPAGAAFVAPGKIAGACLLVSAVLGHAWHRAGTTRQIDISGLGQIHLTVQQHMGKTEAASRPVQLLPGSTVWSIGLLLLLADQQGSALIVVIVLRDSVTGEQFRSLAVAIKAIATRDHSLNKIF